MTVVIYLSSREKRTVDGDAVRFDGNFLIVTREDRTVLTLWAGNVDKAEIEKDGVVIETLPGAAHRHRP